MMLYDKKEQIEVKQETFFIRRKKTVKMKLHESLIVHNSNIKTLKSNDIKHCKRKNLETLTESQIKYIESNCR